MGRFFCFLILLIAQMGFGSSLIQNTFQGPVSLNLWQDWQSHWNIEEASNAQPDFTLTLGRSEPAAPGAIGKGFIELTVHRAHAEGRTASIWGEITRRASQFDIRSEPLTKIDMGTGTASQTGTVFRLETEDFLDQPGLRILTSIAFEVSEKGSPVLQYGVTPMYVRGNAIHVSAAKIDPVLLHNGSGEIEVALWAAPKEPSDSWEGRSIETAVCTALPVKLGANAKIGCHRHQTTNEMVVIQTGIVEMVHGSAVRSSANRRATHAWSSTVTKETDQFSASGGWIEKRALGPGDVAWIVPDPKDADRVCFHGLLALAPSQVLLLGSGQE
jgi:hypothetical protein